MKKLEKSENEAVILVFLWLAGFGAGCYLHSLLVIALVSIYLATLLACSWRIERLERRIDYYRQELGRQIRDEFEEEPEEPPTITISKGA